MRGQRWCSICEGAGNQPRNLFNVHRGYYHAGFTPIGCWDLPPHWFIPEQAKSNHRQVLSLRTREEGEKEITQQHFHEPVLYLTNKHPHTHVHTQKWKIQMFDFGKRLKCDVPKGKAQIALS